MLTPEREKEIREVNNREGPSIICNELLAEIDRLREQLSIARQTLGWYANVIAWNEDDRYENSHHDAQEALRKMDTI